MARWCEEHKTALPDDKAVADHILYCHSSFREAEVVEPNTKKVVAKEMRTMPDREPEDFPEVEPDDEGTAV